MNQYAVADIGTNSARLMIAHTNKSSVVADYKTLRYVRVGEGLKTITDAAVGRAAEAINEFKQISKTYNTSGRFYCFATSAVRDAKNSSKFIDYILKECGIKIDIVSGEKEALLGFAGCVDGRGGMFDIGGGSTEVMTGSIDNIAFQKSYAIGTVRCHQLFPGGDIADKGAFGSAHSLAADTFKDVPAARGFAYTAIGGTPTALAAIDLGLEKYDAKLIHGHTISRQRARTLCDLLKSKTKRQRMESMGLEDRKADVIVFGAILLSEFMKAANADYVTVSDSDNLEGYLKLKLALV
ncbi:MAG: hypothetical protein WDA65_02075 [Christensenellales bacterium]